MKVLFLYPNRNPFPFPIAPIGILTLAGILKEQGHQVEVIDLMFSESPEADIKGTIGAFAPDLVGISIRNYNNQDPINFDSYVEQIAGYVRLIRTQTAAAVVCGGAGFTRLPKEILAAIGADYGIAGEAEESFPLFLRKLTDGEGVESVPGIVYRDGTRIFQTAWLPLQDLNRYPFQDFGLIDYRRYLDQGGYVAIETKRGCPNECVYCDDSLIYGRSVRLKKPERVVDEIEHVLTTYGFRDFYFADSLFTLPTSHFQSICREIIRRDLRIRFETEATPAGISKENALLLKKAGCIGIFFTIDTGSPAMLRSLRKSFEIKDIYRAAEAFSSARLPYAVCINLGGPGETRQTFSETIQLLKNLPDYSAVFFGLGFKVEKGTGLDKMAKEIIMLNEDSDYIDRGLYFAEGFGPSFLTEINNICRENPGWVELHPEMLTGSDILMQPATKKKKPTKPGWLNVKRLSAFMQALAES